MDHCWKILCYRHFTLTLRISQCPHDWSLLSLARMNDEWEGSQEEERARVGEVMLLSCLFLIGLSRDEEHNNSFVGSEGGERVSVWERAHTCRALCVTVCECRACRFTYCELVPLGYSRRSFNSSPLSPQTRGEPAMITCPRANQATSEFLSRGEKK